MRLTAKSVWKVKGIIMNSATLATLTFLTMAAGGGGLGSAAPDLPPLSSLVPGCTLERAPLGPLVPVGRQDGIWLTCQQVRMLVVHPDNLLGKVDIKTPEQALEFVRFFSSIVTFPVLHGRGCVEIMGESSDGLFYRLDPAVFKRRFLAPVSEATGSEKAKDFTISRVVVCADQGVYQLEEQLAPDGMSFETSRKRLLKSAGSLGIVHVSNH